MKAFIIKAGLTYSESQTGGINSQLNMHNNRMFSSVFLVFSRQFEQVCAAQITPHSFMSLSATLSTKWCHRHRLPIYADRLDVHFAYEAGFELTRSIIPVIRTLRPKVDACLVSRYIVRLPSEEVFEFHRIRHVAFRLCGLHSPDKTRPTSTPSSSRIHPLSGCPQKNPLRADSFAFFQPLTCIPRSPHTHQRP